MDLGDAMEPFGYTSKNIKVLKGLSGLRKSYTMYSGGSGVVAQRQMWKEGTDNSVDEHELLGHNKPIEILYCVREGRYQYIIKDFGRGIPTESLRDVTSEPHSSGKFDDDAYQASIGTHGLGLKLIMATAKNAIVMTSHNNELAFIRYHRIVEKAHRVSYNDTGRDTGTLLFVEPDDEIFKDLDQFETDKEGLPSFLDYLKFLCVFVDNVVVKVSKYDRWLNFDTLTSMMMKGHSVSVGYDEIEKLKIKSDVFVKTDKLTLETYIKEHFETNVPKAWELTDLSKDFNRLDKNDRLSYDVKLFLTRNLRVNKGGIMATVNNTQINDPTSHHISVLSEAIKEMIEPNFEDMELRSFFRSMYKLPIYTVVRVRYKGANFTDQTKKGFKEDNFSRIYKASLLNKFNNMDPHVWSSLFDLLQEDITKRFRDSFANKYTAGVKGLKNIELDLENPNCFRGCISNDKRICELFIVEGQSAKGTASQAALNYSQAIFCQEGKPINGIRATDAEFFKDPYIKDLMKILNVSPKDVTLDNMNFCMIYLLADADNHGLHICCLMLGNLYRINPLIIEQGRVSVSNPPLYSLAVRDKLLYLKDYDAIMETKVRSLYQTVFDIKVKPKNSDALISLSDSAFINFCYLLNHICSFITKAASSIGASPYHVEVLLKNLLIKNNQYELDMPVVQQCLGASKIQEKGEYLMISENEIDIPFPWKRFKEECSKYLLYEYNKFHCRNYDVFVSTKLTDYYVDTPVAMVTLFANLSELDSYLGRVGHFKGLGEMKPKQLRETCFDPNTKSAIIVRSIGDINTVYGMLGVDTKQRKSLVSNRFIPTQE